MIETKQTIDFDKALPLDEQYRHVTAGEVVESAFAMLMQHCHAASYNRGWWHDPITGLSLIPGDHLNSLAFDHLEAEQLIAAFFPYVVATKIALIHSEASEMLEAHRRDQRDDKIAFAGMTAEGGDIIIRVCDLLGMLSETTEHFEDYNLGAAILAKLPVNAARADHDLAKRAQPGGKKY